MSKDSHFHYVHLHAPRHADLLEDFCTPLRDATTTSSGSNAGANTTSASTTANLQITHQADLETQRVPGHFLPFEDVHLPSHLEPVNPEDEDGVVPDEHAMWGIKRAMQQREHQGMRREDLWRDLGMEGLLVGSSRVGGVRREGKRSAVLSMR